MSRCRYCSRRIWPWQKTASWGPIGHSRATADHIAHMTCSRERIARIRSARSET